MVLISDKKGRGVVIKTNYPNLSFETGSLYIFQSKVELEYFSQFSLIHWWPNAIDSVGNRVNLKSDDYYPALIEIAGRDLFLISVQPTAEDAGVGEYRLKDFPQMVAIPFVFTDKIRIITESEEW